jgi:hypothetical protein
LSGGAEAAALSLAQVCWGIIPISLPQQQQPLARPNMKYANQPFRFAVTFRNAFGINPFGSLSPPQKRTLRADKPLIEVIHAAAVCILYKFILYKRVDGKYILHYGLEV